MVAYAREREQRDQEIINSCLADPKTPQNPLPQAAQQLIDAKREEIRRREEIIREG
jgi:hypothetical protein